MFVLTRDQQEHQAKLLRCLLDNRIAYDTSATGSGKTIVAAKIVKQLGLRLIVLGTPILKENWDRVLKAEEWKEYEFVSIYKKSFTMPAEDCFVVLDECHSMKNHCQRTERFIEEICNDRAVRYILMLSATPFDHPRHRALVNDVVYQRSSLRDFDRVRYGMDFYHSTKIRYQLYKVQLTEEEETLYYRGFKSIQGSLAEEEGKQQFMPQMFSAGLRKIHCSLFEGMMRYVAKLVSQGAKKIIVVMKYSQHFEQFQQLYPGALILNGSVPQNCRPGIIERFQKSDVNMLAITDAIGGVGIDLDDQEGDKKRYIVALPLFAADFVQLAGRVRRRNTKSDSIITVIQPTKMKSTYFKNQMKTKLTVLTTFNNSLEFMSCPKEEVEHKPECEECMRLIEEHCPVPEIINYYFCECQ